MLTSFLNFEKLKLKNVRYREIIKNYSGFLVLILAVYTITGIIFY